MRCQGFGAMFIFLLALFLSSPVLTAAETTIEDIFQEANEAYSRGDYASAISSYEQITTLYGYSPEILFNLANSYGQAGETGKAILSYERALRLKPSDPDIIGNLSQLKRLNLSNTRITIICQVKIRGCQVANIAPHNGL